MLEYTAKCEGLAVAKSDLTLASLIKSVLDRVCSPALSCAAKSTSPAPRQFGREPQQDAAALPDDQLPNDDFGFGAKRFEPRPAPSKAPREGKTKEELAAIRKAWMKTKFKDRANPKDPLSATATTVDNNTDLFNKSIKAEK